MIVRPQALGRRRFALDRALVITWVLGCVTMAGPVPHSLGGWGPLLLGGLVGVDTLLIGRTGAVAFTGSGKLDERLAGVRDRAYRLAFRLTCLGVVLLLTDSVLGGLLMHQFVQTRDAVLDGVAPRIVLVLIQVSLMTPTLTVAWSQAPETAGPDPASRGRLALLGAGLALAATVAVSFLDAQATGSGESRVKPDGQISGTSITGCTHFVSVTYLGLGIGDALRARAEVCWDGRLAWVDGGGGELTMPPQVPSSQRAFPSSSFMDCGLDRDQRNFVQVSGNRCTETIDNDGTVRYQFRAQTRAALLGMVPHETSWDLVVSRDGEVLRSVRR